MNEGPTILSSSDLIFTFLSYVNGQNVRYINGNNPFTIKIDGEDAFVFIKNLSPARLSNNNPDIWRIHYFFYLDTTLKIEFIQHGIHIGVNKDSMSGKAFLYIQGYHFKREFPNLVKSRSRNLIITEMLCASQQAKSIHT